MVNLRLNTFSSNKFRPNKPNLNQFEIKNLALWMTFSPEGGYG